MLDVRKPLDRLHKEWESCRACSLGVRREALDGQFVSGEGSRGGIMFIGEGPGEEEEKMGRPFIGRSGQLLRQIIKKFGLGEYYITNIVTCRSCTPITDEQGLPRFRKNYRGGPPLPMLRDEPPLPIQIASCLPRLYEEIYLVDPVIIVTLGLTASKTLLTHMTSITKDRGQVEQCSIPGAGYKPVVTEKKGAWARKLHGKIELPVQVNEVRYEVMPTLHPAFALRRHADRGKDSPLNQLLTDIRMAIKIYERYLFEGFGVIPTGSSDASNESIQDDFPLEDA